MLDFYVEQHPLFGLGNFINLTPTIHALYNQHRERIPVYFHKKYVRDCYLDSPYIEILDKPRGRRLFGSELICNSNDMPDYQYVQLKVLGYISGKNKPFIDMPEAYEGNYGVFINGAGNQSDNYVNMKCVDEDTQKVISNYSPIDIIGTGSLEDSERNIFGGTYGNVREALRLINGARFVIANDTGFYHAAGVMDKKQLVLWKYTKLPKNKNTSELTQYAYKDEWKNKVIGFLSEYSG